MKHQASDETPSILVVDDNPDNLRVLSGMLRDREYQVRPAPSGKLALKAAQARPPDVILLDVNMPEIDGFEVCRRLKSDEVLKSIPVIFVSALSDSEHKLRGFQSGGIDYVTKPYRIDEVEARIRCHLEIRRLQRDLEKQNRQLEESYEELRRLERLKDDLTRMIIHDLRNPLAVVQSAVGYLQHTSADSEDEGLRTSTEIASSQLGVLLEMINCLLDVSRLEDGKMPVRIETADFGDIIARAADCVGVEEHAFSVELPEEPFPVACDRQLCRRVLTNLIGNAAKFTPRGAEIRVLVEPMEGGAILVNIIDSGCGIPEDYLDRVFDKFSQVDTSMRKKVHSTGLGLTFCKLAVEAHGGEIGVRSQMGTGSTFWFTLPHHDQPEES